MLAPPAIHSIERADGSPFGAKSGEAIGFLVERRRQRLGRLVAREQEKGISKPLRGDLRSDNLRTRDGNADFIGSIRAFAGEHVGLGSYDQSRECDNRQTQEEPGIPPHRLYLPLFPYSTPTTAKARRL
jgi:hypothetical protein